MLLTPKVFPHLCQVIHKTVPKKKNLGKNVLKLDIFASLLLHTLHQIDLGNIFNFFIICIISFFASLFLDKRLIDDSIHYHFSNNLLVHTYLSTTDYADYYPTQDNIVTWNTNHSIYNVWMQNFHCITPIYSIWQRDKISKWETEYTKNIFLTVQCVTWYVDICGTIGAIDNTACKIC